MNVEQLDTLPAGLHLWFDQVSVTPETADSLRVLFCEPPRAWRFIQTVGIEVSVYLNINGKPCRIGTEPLPWVLELLGLLEELRDRQATAPSVQ